MKVYFWIFELRHRQDLRHFGPQSNFFYCGKPLMLRRGHSEIMSDGEEGGD